MDVDRISCISFDSYIKPQPSLSSAHIQIVVYLLIPTSNHNSGTLSYSALVLYIFWFLHQTTTIFISLSFFVVLYIFWFLHQTTTGPSIHPHQWRLYIFWFLHQTTTCSWWFGFHSSCISFDSYIKPQLIRVSVSMVRCCISFDSYIKPQRHSYRYVSCLCCISFDSYIKPQPRVFIIVFIYVVYLLIPTSNHNS